MDTGFGGSMNKGTREGTRGQVTCQPCEHSKSLGFIIGIMQS